MDSMDKDLYPSLSAYTSPVKEAQREIIGREKEMMSVRASFERPELCNVLLLGDAGSGKTALVQGIMKEDKSRVYLEVDLAKMIMNLNNSSELASKVKQLFDEALMYRLNENIEVVLFIDEFHQIVQLSAAAVEALKPMLADSGTRGLRVIVATTYDEFYEHISGNQPLVERLQRISLKQPNKDMVVNILRGMAERYGVGQYFTDNYLFELIYDYTNRYIPASSQPRKSILVLDSMVGWHKAFNRDMDKLLLADVLEETAGVTVDFKVDAMSIKERLDKVVLSQKYATFAIEERLQLCVADLNDKSKPMASFLFTGSTGVGKTEMTKQLAGILYGDSKNLIRFDMTEYANSDSLERFRDTLTTKIWERPHSIILMDEIEKACSEVTRVLLQVLDDGRLSNRHGRETSFVNSYIVLTTNAASEIYKTIAQYGSDDEGSGDVMKKYDRLIRRSISETTGDRFPPELLGRVDKIVPFQPLSNKTMENIVIMKLRQLRDEVLHKHNIDLSIDEQIVEYLVYDNLSTDSDSGGARRVMSKLEEEVSTAIARFLNKYSDNKQLKHIGVQVHGELAYHNKFKLESEAYVEVFAIN